ncbi:hypothetical protein [Prolixibacter sp. NT017]|uniref:hypothetical protein n=1 Tax=Prolixibacter sp. NT017 TaxID=2652390 RepID=UPI0012742499|nr:hypothetical protein [Prolixibacter sp. NT017]GET25517.1 hypothetical protein NT017_18460 [Prolixibacter sp. NT017]
MKKMITYILFSFLVLNVMGQEIEFLSIEEDICKPLLFSNDIVFSYRTKSCGYISAYLKSTNYDFVLFTNKKEYFGEGKIHISPNDLTRWIRKSSLYNTRLLLTHTSCRNNRNTENSTPLNIKVNAPYGTSLLEYPQKPNLLNTNLKIRIKKVNPASYLYFTIGIGLCIGSIAYAVENKIFETDDDNIAVNTGLLLGGGIGLISLGGSSYYKYRYIPDVQQNDLNERRNRYLISEWEMQYKQVERQNKLIKNTFTIRILLK